MKDNKYEDGDAIPEGLMPGDLVDVGVEQEKLGIVPEPRSAVMTIKQLEDNLKDATNRIKELEAWREQN